MALLQEGRGKEGESDNLYIHAQCTSYHLRLNCNQCIKRMGILFVMLPAIQQWSCSSFDL